MGCHGNHAFSHSPNIQYMDMIKELIENCFRDLDLISKVTAGSKCFIYATKCKYAQYLLEGLAELNKKLHGYNI